MSIAEKPLSAWFINIFVVPLLCGDDSKEEILDKDQTNMMMP